jgi:tripartite-type tricarboxylate transporter receptor subunit TctC
MAHSSAHVYPNAPYDTANDFAAIAAFGSSPNVTVVSPEKDIKTLQQLVAAAKAKPGSITFGTVGVGSATHISAEILRFAAGFEALHVPFRGMPEILTEIMSERVDFTCSTIATALPFIREGKLVALAVSTPQRSSALPDVPTTLEAGYKNSDYTFWTGLFVPARHRARSSTNLPRRRRRHWPHRACGRNSRNKAWTRCRSRPLPSMRRSGARSVQFSPWPKPRT